MDDIELLELAAKAADIEVTSAIVDLWRSKEWSSVWNPLRSSGHALELAIRCELDIVLTMHGAKVAREDGIICTTPDFKPGDQAPEGYLAWHEWAEVQHKAGLRQKECGRCGKWRYPQELSDQIDRHEAKSRKGPVTVETAVCLHCVTPNAELSGASLAERPTRTPG